MIEQYFRPGVRYLWNKPNDAIGPLNGALVPSVMAFNNLTYDGLDGHQAVIDPPLLVNVNATLGLAMRATVPHSWLDYAPGRTSYLQIGGNDILTGYMSGCLIARGTHLGVMSAFHVGTIVGNPGVNQTVKQNFFANLPADVTGFNPAGAWTHGEVAAIQASLGGGGGRYAQHSCLGDGRRCVLFDPHVQCVGGWPMGQSGRAEAVVCGGQETGATAKPNQSPGQLAISGCQTELCDPTACIFTMVFACLVRNQS